MKYVLVLFAVMMVLVSTVYAEDDKWIDGIRFRYGQEWYETYISIPLAGKDTDIIKTENTISKFTPISQFPIAITLPEILMNSWSFRGAFLEYQNRTELKDLAPQASDNVIHSDTTNWRQKPDERTYIYNNLFTASDKTFADANSNWALSADTVSSRFLFGYNWGVFIPVGEYNRFFKFGLGPAIYYLNFSMKLNLCSEYKITPSPGKSDGHSSECVGKREIDSASIDKVILATSVVVSLWERFTKDSVWRILSWSSGDANFNVKLKNNSMDLVIKSRTAITEFISYTYRF
jgi:hypothetical protein|tara:strand:+ start:277 stop:1149 length:873 start_codon:yes stop_codon:yes gene_type:complete